MALDASTEEALGVDSIPVPAQPEHQLGVPNASGVGLPRRSGHAQTGSCAMVAVRPTGGFHAVDRAIGLTFRFRTAGHPRPRHLDSVPGTDDQSIAGALHRQPDS